MDKKEFEMQKELIELRRKAELEVESYKHKNKIEEINLEKEVRLEIQRIRGAEIRKNIQRQADKKFMESYR